MKRTNTVKTVAGLVGLAFTVAACDYGNANPTPTETDPVSTTKAGPASTDTTAETAPESTDTTASTESGETDVTTEGKGSLHLTFEGLEPLGDDYNYEAWTIVDEKPVTAGVFDLAEDSSLVDAEGNPAVLTGSEGATDVVISIEPAEDPDPAPAATKILGGPIAEDGTVELATSHPAALGTDFSDVSGSYVLATPTTKVKLDELSGIWFLNESGPSSSLILPELPEGWLYEGWVVIDGTPVSTGTFSKSKGPDNFNGFSGPKQGPGFPGEDFITNAPDGLEFPLDLSGEKVVISVEPDPDNSTAPFALKPLAGDIPEDAKSATSYDLEAKPTTVTGEGTHKLS